MIEERVAHYMALPYRMEVYQDGDTWAAEFPELPGLGAGHETWEGLQAAILDAKRTYFEGMLEEGFSIPEPAAEQKEFSGKVVVRFPKTIHRDLSRAAEREGVSLNTLVVSAVARELGRKAG